MYSMHMLGSTVVFHPVHKRLLGCGTKRDLGLVMAGMSVEGT